ncbi:hypothetical protein [Opitutus terrae]|uniref:Uncharacterized protein n=1 Tax=Opitutus terrae (strain DSM 11246 / JCM 15787 / PB90-1) TaxID=452637 RepID=B1ZU82_OPITP|nr:hypothetical protein [Opitutus terrae]ACB76691.1 hypothetical protein Oter_3414 [Opitutus terrae PB90-1]
MSDDADIERESDRAIAIEEMHLEHVADLRRHNRQLLWFAAALLVLLGMFAWALITLAERVTVFYMPPARAKAAASAESSELRAGPLKLYTSDFHSRAGGARSFRGLDPAALGPAAQRTLRGGDLSVAPQESGSL